MKNMLGLAIHIAADAFVGKMDAQGEPYILHCLEVMNNVSKRNRIPAVLHDVPEDTTLTIHQLREYGFDTDDLRVIDLLTHRKDEDYLNVYIKKIAMCPRATEIKLADLKHNLDPSRIKGALSKAHFDRIQKYHTAFQYLSKI